MVFKKRKKKRKNFKPLDIIYKSTKNPEISPLCYFIEHISKAYTNFTIKKIKLNALIVAMNAIIADNSF